MLSEASAQMIFRKLRIAISATCLAVALLLCVLWVRSYTLQEKCYYRGPDQSLWAITSDDGNLLLTAGKVNPPRYVPIWSYTKRDSTSVKQAYTNYDLSRIRPPSAQWLRLRVPIWIAVLSMPIIGALPWLRWRFSLRTLLVATTLIALLLGLFVWLR